MHGGYDRPCCKPIQPNQYYYVSALPACVWQHSLPQRNPFDDLIAKATISRLRSTTKIGGLAARVNLICNWRFGRTVTLYGAWMMGTPAPAFCQDVLPRRICNNSCKVSKEWAQFGIDESKLSHFGPDSKFTSILIRFKDKTLQLRSWHELAERDGRVVDTSGGLESLGDRQLMQALENQPSEYLFFRYAWSEIKGRCFKLIPDAGKKVDGEVTMKAGRIFWNESPSGRP